MPTAATPAARRLRWRPLIKLWHRWFGLGTALWLFLLAVTGCAITFYNELDTALNADLRTAAPAISPPASSTPVGDAMTAVAAALPTFKPSQIDLPNKPGEVIWITGRGDAGAVQVFVDPTGGRVLGWRESGKLSLDRRHLMDILYGLHIDLLLGPWVTWFFGLVGLLWLIDHVFAAILAVPRLARIFDAFRITGRPGSVRRLFDLHRAPAMWLMPVTAILALTGMTLAWPEASRHAIRLVSPVSDRLDFEFPEVAPIANPIGIDAAIAFGAAGAVVDSVRPLSDKGVYGVRTFDPRDVDDQGRLWTYVSMVDGRIIGQRHDVGEGPGDAFFAWQYALHSGQMFGLPGRIAVFIGGVGTAALCITGVMLWLRRRG